MNPIWQASSMAVLDYSGNWKMSLNMLKQAFKPVIVSAYFEEKNEDFQYSIVNQGDSDISYATIEVQEYRIDVTS